MNRFGFALSMVALVAAASWTYHVNYRTNLALGRIDRLRAEIAAEREAAGVLRVEWAYLNRPDRLAELVMLNNAQLGLVPMTPQHFGDVAEVPFPPHESELPPPLPAAPDAAAPAGALVAEAATAVPPQPGAVPAVAAPTEAELAIAAQIDAAQTIALASVPMPLPRPAQGSAQGTAQGVTR